MSDNDYINDHMGGFDDDGAYSVPLLDLIKSSKLQHFQYIYK